MAVVRAHPIEEATAESIFGGLSPDRFYQKHGVLHQEEFVQNERGMKIFTQSWIPAAGDDGPAFKAVLLLLHGFSVDSSWLMQLTAVGLASRGFSVHALDYEGHGRSEGGLGRPAASVPDMGSVVDDYLLFADLVRTCNPGLPVFVYAESYGGAVALVAHLRKGGMGGVIDGMVLHGPMIGIAREMMPPRPLEHFLPLGAAIFSTWIPGPLFRVPDNSDTSYKEEWKRSLARSSPCKRTGFADMATVWDMVRKGRWIRARAEKISVPFLIVHGECDLVCDVEIVKELHSRSSSPDKTLIIVPGMWHMFLGEPLDTVNAVFSDIVAWLEDHAKRSGTHSNP